ncbi:hypothetical protein DL546_001026 [Coniochaeta pulveracea]|uniref:Genetic interactor of prohibitins 3, mitochondrial n=1 Tax=Coniochaeta pulveracea TaxID=177199 RepID=A0A420YHQ9_9PEZI|nr:hypothetical protein DL546_001026 [Coniochaeta pulveracea]
MRPTRTLSTRWLRRAFNVETNPVSTELPLYLCPGLLSATRPTTQRACLRKVSSFQTRRLYSNLDDTIELTSTIPLIHPVRPLPVVCSGCGALSQTAEPDQAGYYDLERKAVKSYLGLLPEEKKRIRNEDLVIQEALKNLDLDKLGKAGEALKTLAPVTADTETTLVTTPESAPSAPLCDRCHHLIHHNRGNPIFHPTIASIRETIEESPYKYNHIYHVIDAADFPMSLIPAINDLLDINLRSLNRRSRSSKFVKGRRTELSFIITRADLLAPTKAQVDRLMPQLTAHLRTALGRRGRNIRLGNVWCVSAKNGWWHKEIKEEIWRQGGASWMVGKVNVGKSRLFESIFPKGRMDWKPPKDNISVEVFPDSFEAKFVKPHASRSAADDEASLLPPAQKETNYPAMPLVSSLPGTTASPIRVPFGNGRGELIDLPGLARSDLENHVLEEHRSSLVMKHRVIPEQLVLKPGQSILLGGLIRITPKTPNLVFLGYSFTPLEAHVTSNEKAAAVQEQREDAPKVDSIAAPGTGERIKSAGEFMLRYDITKQRAGPLTRKNAVNLSVDRLAFRIMATDILIEGVGWVEIVAQVRVKDLEPVQQAPKPTTTEPKVSKDKKDEPEILQSLDLLADEQPVEEKAEEEAEPAQPNYPVVEVFSPDGKFIAQRPPINGWEMNKPKKQDLKKRPRPSMKGAAKRERHARQSRREEGN